MEKQEAVWSTGRKAQLGKTLCCPSYAVKMAYFHVDVTWFPIEDKWFLSPWAAGGKLGSDACLSAAPVVPSSSLFATEPCFSTMCLGMKRGRSAGGSASPSRSEGAGLGHSGRRCRDRGWEAPGLRYFGCWPWPAVWELPVPCLASAGWEPWCGNSIKQPSTAAKTSPFVCPTVKPIAGKRPKRPHLASFSTELHYRSVCLMYSRLCNIVYKGRVCALQGYSDEKY